MSFGRTRDDDSDGLSHLSSIGDSDIDEEEELTHQRGAKPLSKAQDDESAAIFAIRNQLRRTYGINVEDEESEESDIYSSDEDSGDESAPDDRTLHTEAPAEAGEEGPRRPARPLAPISSLLAGNHSSVQGLQGRALPWQQNWDDRHVTGTEDWSSSVLARLANRMASHAESDEGAQRGFRFSRPSFGGAGDLEEQFVPAPSIAPQYAADGVADLASQYIAAALSGDIDAAMSSASPQPARAGTSGLQAQDQLPGLAHSLSTAAEQLVNTFDIVIQSLTEVQHRAAQVQVAAAAAARSPRRPPQPPPLRPHSQRQPFQQARCLHSMQHQPRRPRRHGHFPRITRSISRGRGKQTRALKRR
jgi:hypothetical protein